MTLYQPEAEPFEPLRHAAFNLFTLDVEQAHARLREACAEVLPIGEVGALRYFDVHALDGDRIGVRHFPS